MTIAGHKVFAHKVIVCARCDVMGAMFGGHFVEGSNSVSEVDDHCFIANFLSCSLLCDKCDNMQNLVVCKFLISCI